jgi:hypothetical protein
MGEVPDGAYTARISLLDGETVLAGAGEGISVVGGRIVLLSAPATLQPGETGEFQVSFANYLGEQVVAEVQLMIQSEEGGFVKDLPMQNLLVDGASTGTVRFFWVALEVTGGIYAASAKVFVDEQAYGPKSTSFQVEVGSCAFDSDQDGDVDGKDLAIFLSQLNGVEAEDFAGEFGTIGCME